jgi:hypothetical protein
LGSYYCALGDFATAEQLLVQSLSKMQTDSGRSEWAPDKTALVYNALRQAQGSRPENQYMWATGGLGNGRCHVFTLLF